MSGAALGTWFLMFIPMFFAGGSMITGESVWWAWPSVGAVAAACGLYAWRMRRRKPVMASGVWIGIGVGLIHSGLCFYGQ